MQALAAQRCLTSPPPPPPLRQQQQWRRSGPAVGGRAKVPRRLAALDGTEQVGSRFIYRDAMDERRRCRSWLKCHMPCLNRTP